MPRLENLIGRQFGKLTVIGQAPTQKKRRHWDCRCACGNLSSVPTTSLLSGNSKTCGCGRIEGTIRASTRHGGSPRGGQSREYVAWLAMRSRCLSPTNSKFSDYGGRGIRISKRWSRFEQFLSDMGTCPAGYTLDRIQPNGNYTPKNCRWASRVEQTRNRRCTLRMRLGKISKSLAEWSEILGIRYATLKARKTTLGWSDKKALLTPVRKQTC